MYAYKIKQFLLAFALGMTVSSPWDGCFNACLLYTSDAADE